MGKIISISNSQRVIVELMRYARQIPTVPVARHLNLKVLAEARAQSPHPPSWTALMLRAYGCVCARFAHLRRVWLSWPRARLYEHPHSVCAVAVERDWQGEHVLMFPQIHNPEQTFLDDVQRQLRRFKEADVLSIARYRRQLLFSRLPTLVQRLLMWHKMDWSGRRRVKYMGTFGLTNYGMLGAESLHPIGPQTTILTLGPISPAGETTVRLVYDHRVVNGGYVARALNYLEEVLQTSVLTELQTTVQNHAVLPAPLWGKVRVGGSFPHPAALPGKDPATERS